MSKLCLTHRDRPAVAMCHQCHKPVCQACTLIQPHGQFCSPECSILNRDYKRQNAELKTAGMGFGQKILAMFVVLVVVLFAAGVIAHFGLGRLVQKVKQLNR